MSRVFFTAVMPLSKWMIYICFFLFAHIKMGLAYRSRRKIKASRARVPPAAESNQRTWRAHAHNKTVKCHNWWLNIKNMSFDLSEKNVIIKKWRISLHTYGVFLWITHSFMYYQAPNNLKWMNVVIKFDSIESDSLNIYIFFHKKTSMFRLHMFRFYKEVVWVSIHLFAHFAFSGNDLQTNIKIMYLSSMYNRRDVIFIDRLGHSSHFHNFVFFCCSVYVLVWLYCVHTTKCTAHVMTSVAYCHGIELRKGIDSASFDKWSHRNDKAQRHKATKREMTTKGGTRNEIYEEKRGKKERVLSYCAFCFHGVSNIKFRSILCMLARLIDILYLVRLAQS